jgi:hypothetical protein
VWEAVRGHQVAPKYTPFAAEPGTNLQVNSVSGPSRGLGGCPDVPLLPDPDPGGLRGGQGLAQHPLLPVTRPAHRQAAAD